MFFPNGGKAWKGHGFPDQTSVTPNGVPSSPLFAPQRFKFFNQPWAILSHLHQDFLDATPFTLERTLSSKPCYCIPAKHARY